MLHEHGQTSTTTTIWPFSNLSQQHATCSNILQQGRQTCATRCAQQCCDMLQWNLDLTKSLGTGQIRSLNQGFFISRFYHTFYYYWGKECRSVLRFLLNRGSLNRGFTVHWNVAIVWLRLNNFICSLLVKGALSRVDMRRIQGCKNTKVSLIFSSFATVTVSL